MNSNGDDVSALYKSFGADHNSFQELARQADAKDAEARWPLFRSILPQSRVVPPLLTVEEKNQLWSNHHAKPVNFPEPVPSVSPSLGQKLATSLQVLKVAAQPVKHDTCVDVYHTSGNCPLPVEDSKHDQSVRTFLDKSEHVSSAKVSRGMECDTTHNGFLSQPLSGRKKVVHDVVENSLLGVFERIAGRGDLSQVKSRKRKGFLERLGKL